jgi:hypothetical protein
MGERDDLPVNAPKAFLGTGRKINCGAAARPPSMREIIRMVHGDLSTLGAREVDFRRALKALGMDEQPQ